MASILKRSYRTPEGVVKMCRHWTIEYRDSETGKLKRVKGYKDKQATKQLAAKLESAIARGEQGLVDPYRDAKAKPLAEHVADWIADRRTAGKSFKYLDTAEKRLKIVLDGCSWKRFSDVEPNSFLRWRERQKAAPRRGTRLERDAEGKAKAGAVAATTLNQYLDTARAFLNWCVDKKRIGSNALALIDRVDGEKVRKRRALTDEQVAVLLSKAPAERKLVYRTALAVGLRRSELEDLQWGDLGLNAIRPYVQLRAEATKARRGDRVPLPASLAADLRKDKPADARDHESVFPRVPSLELWQKDLAAAGIPYRDDQGRQADFHGGTRKTLCTRMHRGNVPLAVAMRVMRHTDARLTMVDYADDGQLGIETLPEVAEAAPLSQQVNGGSAAGA